MVTLDLSRVDRKAQGPLELKSYLFSFGPTPSHITKAQLKWPKRLTQLDNQLQVEKYTKFCMMYEMVCMWV